MHCCGVSLTEGRRFLGLGGRGWFRLGRNRGCGGSVGGRRHGLGLRRCAGRGGRGTLREVVDDREALRELGERLDGPLAEDQDNVTRAGLLSVRAEVYRLLGELGMAAAASRLALVHAESSGDVQAIVIAQAELAHVLRLRGDFAEADRLFEQAASSESAAELRSVVHENAGRCCFEDGPSVAAETARVQLTR